MRILVPVLIFTLVSSFFVADARGDETKLREEIGILRAEKQALEDRVRKLTEQLQKAQAVEAELVKLRSEIARGFDAMSDRIARLEGGSVRVATNTDPRPVSPPTTTTTPTTTPSVTRTTPAVTAPTVSTPTTTTPAITPPKTTTTPTFIPPTTLARIPDPTIPTTPPRNRPRVDRPSGTPTTVAMVDMVSLWSALKEKTAIEEGLSDLVYAVQFADQATQKRVRQLELDLSLLADGSEAAIEKRRQIESAIIDRNVALGTARTRLNRRRGELTKLLYAKMVEAIGRVADENGYDAVIFKESDPNYSKISSINELLTDRMVVIGTESVDLTEQAIRLMNREFDQRTVSP